MKTGARNEYLPIFQALAPYLIAGCCVVNGLVPRTLFMVIFIIKDRLLFVNDFSRWIDSLKKYKAAEQICSAVIISFEEAWRLPRRFAPRNDEGFLRLVGLKYLIATSLFLWPYPADAGPLSKISAKADIDAMTGNGVIAH